MTDLTSQLAPTASGCACREEGQGRTRWEYVDGPFTHCARHVRSSARERPLHTANTHLQSAAKTLTIGVCSGRGQAAPALHTARWEWRGRVGGRPVNRTSRRTPLFRGLQRAGAARQLSPRPWPRLGDKSHAFACLLAQNPTERATHAPVSTPNRPTYPPGTRVKSHGWVGGRQARHRPPRGPRRGL